MAPVILMLVTLLHMACAVPASLFGILQSDTILPESSTSPPSHLDTRDIDLPSYVSGAFSAFRSDAGIADYQLKWSAALTQRAQSHANECNGNVPWGAGVRGTVYEAINDQEFNVESETKMALAFWFIEGMGEFHENSDAIKDPAMKFVGCAWSDGCGAQHNDHYFKCALSAAENPGRKRDDGDGHFPVREASVKRNARDVLEPQAFDPNLQAKNAINKFRIEEFQLPGLGVSQRLVFEAYRDANSCKDNPVSSELNFKVVDVAANYSVMTDAILLFWEYLTPAWSHPLLKSNDIRYLGCSWSDWCADNTLEFRCKFGSDEEVEGDALSSSSSSSSLVRRTPELELNTSIADRYGGLNCSRNPLPYQTWVCASEPLYYNCSNAEHKMQYSLQSPGCDMTCRCQGGPSSGVPPGYIGSPPVVATAPAKRATSNTDS